MTRLGIDTVENAQAFQRVIEHLPEGRQWLRRAIQPVAED